MVGCEQRSPPLDLGQQQNSGIRGQSTTVKSNVNRLAHDG